MRSFTTLILLAGLLNGPAHAAVKSEKMASNGVVVTVYDDDFADRHEFSAPIINTSVAGGQGFIMVAATKAVSLTTPISLIGSVTYYGDWRRYDGAILQGGEPVEYINTDRKVGSCWRGSCSLSERFVIKISPEQIKSHLVDGNLLLQVRSSGSAHTYMATIPGAHFDALKEFTGQ